jgi:excisionase family DNA binding protein
MVVQQQVLSPDFSVGDVCKKLKVSERHMREQLSLGKIPFYKVGRSVRIPAEAVDLIRSGQTVKPDDDELDAHIRRLVDAAPTLTAAQRDRLAVLLADDEPPPKAKRRSNTRGRGSGAAKAAPVKPQRRSVSRD